MPCLGRGSDGSRGSPKDDDLSVLGSALGIVLIGAILWKYLQTPKFDYVSVELSCRHCGDRTNGLKCSCCENKKISTKY